MLHRENKVRQYHTSPAADLLKEVMDTTLHKLTLLNESGKSEKYF